LIDAKRVYDFVPYLLKEKNENALQLHLLPAYLITNSKYM